MNELERRLAAAHGVLRRADHRDLSGTLDRALRDGRLCVLHPGVYVVPDQVELASVRIRAAAAWAGPDAVLTGWAAARLSYWPGGPLPGIRLAQATSNRRSRGDVTFERRRIPPELVMTWAGLRLTRPCLTAVDLAAAEKGGEAIDVALRRRAATLDQLWEAFAATPSRPGNARRRQLLVESRTSPWSEAERELHRLFHGAGVRGWRANVAVLGYFVDVLFAAEMVVVEVDGWETHGSRAAFEADRERRNALELAGYLVLNFTWRHISERPEWVLHCIEEARRRRRDGSIR